MKIAAAYIRVSTDDQLEYSPDSQLVQIRRYAKANGFTLPEEYIFIEEEGRSGRYSVKRPEFLQMISTAKKKPKPFDAILVWKYSRFAAAVRTASSTSLCCARNWESRSSRSAKIWVMTRCPLSPRRSLRRWTNFTA